MSNENLDKRIDFEIKEIQEELSVSDEDIRKFKVILELDKEEHEAIGSNE